jgi:1-acyl-sn-glycerol-3-phosphate acyltransferase
MNFNYCPTLDFGTPLPKRLGLYPRVPDMTWDFCRWLGCWMSVLFIRTQFRLKIAGTLPDAPKVAVVANHQSHLDTATVLAALPYGQRKNLIVLAAEDYFFQSVPKAMLASLLCQGVAFDRLHWTAIRGWYQHLQNLKAGWVLFYPSGSRHSRDIQPGLLKLLLKEGWTILPVHLEGVEQAWPPHQKCWRPGCALKATFFEPYRGNDLEILLTKLKKELYPQ